MDGASKTREEETGMGAENQNLRDPEDRPIDESNVEERRDKMMDKTVADTFPASDPPSSLPDPDDDSFAA
jgi:hypothetical protein